MMLVGGSSHAFVAVSTEAPPTCCSHVAYEEQPIRKISINRKAVEYETACEPAPNPSITSF